MAYRLLLGSPKNARRTLSRLCREFHGNPEADVQRFRALVYAIKTVTELYAIEREEAIIARLDRIEDGMKHGGSK
jgi:hypothetical protein